MDGHRDHRLARALLALLAIVVLSGQILEAGRAPSIPVPGMALRDNQVFQLEEGAAAARAGIRVGDVITQVGPQRVSSTYQPGILLARVPRETGVWLSLLRGQEVVHLILYPENPKPIEIMWRLALAAVGIFTLLIGFLVYFKKPRQLTLIFAGICFGMGYLLHPPFVPMVAGMLLAAEILADALTLFIPPLLVHLFLLFPNRHPALERRRRLTTILYLPSFLVLLFFHAFRIGGVEPSPDSGLYAIAQFCAFIVWTGGSVVALWLFVRSYRRAQTDTARAMVRVVLWGTLLGLLPQGLMLALLQIWPEAAFPGARLTVLAVVLIPLSFGYAIVRHGIFDATHIVRRSLGLTGAALLIVGVYLGAYVMMRELLQPIPQVSPLWISFLSMVIAGGLYLVTHQRVERLLGQALGTRRKDHQTLLFELTQTLRGLEQRDAMVRTVVAFTGEALRCDRIAFFEKSAADNLEVAYLDGLPIEQLRCYQFGRDLSRKLEALAVPTDRGDIETDLPFGYISTSDQEVLDCLGTEVLVPLRSKGEFRGLMSVGGQTLREPFTQDDLRTAEMIAAEGSIALENADFHAKERTDVLLRDDMDKARDLLERLLPKQVPQMESLEISRFWIPAQVVGGDYYNCFRNPWGELVLAIGDASGKGVSGAILMASLHGLVKGEGARQGPPEELIERINRRLCEMNKPERYITFCLARIDPLTGSLAYCNAGHPSILLVRSDGEIEQLGMGGLPLGIRPQATYQGGRTVMRAGDLVLLYTDGITERCRDEKMFGERRLIELVRANRRMRAGALKEAILSEVRNFADTPLDDDTTLLLVKML